MGGMKVLYKCCWNCGNGFNAVAESKSETEKFNATKRFCCASRPISDHGENPFKQRYCKQFEEPFRMICRRGHFITKEEAVQLNKMTSDELMQYWKQA